MFSYVQMSTATQLQGDSLRHQTQLFEQYSAEHGLDLDEDAIGVSAFDGSNIVHYLATLSVCPRCDSMRKYIAPRATCANLLSSPARRIASIDRVGPPPKMIRLEGEVTMNITSGALKRLAYVVLACAMVQIALRPDAAMAEAADAARAQALLERAVTHYKEVEESALAAFGHKGKFVDGELYVYVISAKGVMLASGGPSSALIGHDVTDLQDAAGKPFFREMLDKAKASGSGAVEYYWLNPVDNKMQRKLAYFQKVDDRIIAVGYYIARATPAQAQALLDAGGGGGEGRSGQGLPCNQPVARSLFGGRFVRLCRRLE